MTFRLKGKLKKKKVFRIKGRKKLEASITYDASIARRFHDTRYYESMQSDIKLLPVKDYLRKRYMTRRRVEVSKLIEEYKALYHEKAQGIFYQLEGIYKRNLEQAFNKAPFEQRKVTNILWLISSVPMLAVAYKKIRKNKGATTLGYMLSPDRYYRKFGRQKSFLNRTFNLPDGMSKYILQEASRLLRMGKYPWGASRRVYVSKPGRPDSLRPVTIPPFMDRVVQCAITMVLEAIYEPWFERYNCSFGFRPHKGVHDAMYAIMHNKNNGLNHAIEGDIKAAYDKVCKDKLIKILNTKIQDNRFMNLIKQRLDYQFYDSTKNKYVVEKEGLPQGGIDSPYLWNIYMFEFDKFVLNETGRYFEELNSKIVSDVSLGSKRTIERQRYCCKWLIQVFNKFPNQHDLINDIIGYAKPKVKPPEIRFISDILGRKAILEMIDWDEVYKQKTDTNVVKYKLIDILNKLNHKFINLPTTNQNKKILRFSYVRYADDWIVLTNAPEYLNQELKNKYKDFLRDELSATLADDKTFITDFRKKPAHFLGFEIRTARGMKIGRYTRKVGDKEQKIKANTTGCRIHLYPDKTRLINRLYMKGYCEKDGFPREIGWLSHLEPHVIIERFNSVIQGFANFYTEFIYLPGKYLSFWVYILRYSCLKTLAQKFKCSIKKVLSRFNCPTTKDDTSRTVRFEVQLEIKGKTYTKVWKLLTLKEALANAWKIGRKPKVVQTFKNLAEGKPVSYEIDQGIPNITTDNYLDKIHWVNLRSQSGLDFPCSICGSDYQVEMHHIRHIRKKSYELIPEDKQWEKLMSLRNRKQIPVCRECHINVIHKGKYGGTRLGYLAPKVYYDGRIMVLESHIHKGVDRDYTKTLEERGWEAKE